MIQKEQLRKRNGELKKTSVKIVGMTCTSCAQTIEAALSRTEGVRNASVNFATETAYIDYDAVLTNENALEQVIKDTGYDVFKGTQKIIMRIEASKKPM
jgi:Cu+-exporting ATPase